MNYQWKNEDKIHQLLGKETLEKLFCFVNDGTLVKDNLESMSYSHNMNVSQTYTMYEGLLPSKILEKMLDDWYEKTLCTMSPADAKKRLHEILEKTCARVIAAKVEEVMGKQGTGAGDARNGGTGGVPAPASGLVQNTIGNNTQPIMNWGTINYNKQ